MKQYFKLKVKGKAYFFLMWKRKMKLIAKTAFVSYTESEW